MFQDAVTERSRFDRAVVRDDDGDGSSGNGLLQFDVATFRTYLFESELLQSFDRFFPRNNWKFRHGG